MSAKKAITKDRIISAALEIVRKKGMQGLNMRALANACKCSTQPIYLSFSGAEELKRAVGLRISQIYNKYISDEIASGKYPEYKAMGMGYIRFAKEEPKLFGYLFMRDRNGSVSEEEQSYFNGAVAQITDNMNIPRDKAAELHTHMWVWVHGIAVMYATGYLDWDGETVGRMLTDAFLGIKARLGV